MESSFHIEKKKLNEFIMIPKQFWKLPEYYNSWTTRIQIAKTFTVLHVSDCNPKWLQTIYLSPSYTQRASGYCTPCDSLRTSARQSDALSHGCRLVKLRHIMWCALNQWKGRILVRGVINVNITLYFYSNERSHAKVHDQEHPQSVIWHYSLFGVP